MSTDTSVGDAPGCGELPSPPRQHRPCRADLQVISGQGRQRRPKTVSGLGIITADVDVGFASPCAATLATATQQPAIVQYRNGMTETLLTVPMIRRMAAIVASMARATRVTSFPSSA